MDVAQLRARLGDAIAEGDDALDAGRVLSEAAIGYLALEGGGWPYVVPINFAYDGSTVHFHGGGSLKASLLEADPRVCLAVTTQPEFIPADGPCNDNFRYESVLVFGEVERLTDDAERDRVLRLIVEKYRSVGPRRVVHTGHVQGHRSLLAQRGGADLQAEPGAVNRAGSRGRRTA